MDLALLTAAALPFVGYYLNKGEPKKGTSQPRASVPLEEKGNGDNLYNSTRYTEVDKYERGLVDNSWEKAKDTTNTNIVPMFYNTMGPQVINYNPVRNTNINPIVNKPSRLRSDTGTDISYTGESFSRQYPTRFDQTAKAQPPNIPIRRDSRGYVQRGTNHEGFTVHGPQNSSNPMVHNNMVPFFKGQVKQNMDPYAHASSLEAFTGQTGNISERKAMSKEEVPYMFAPQKGITYPYGTPNVGNYGRERYITSELKTSVPAVSELRVGPGLDYGSPGVNGALGSFPSAPKDGFHPMYRPVERNIDELRVNKKPTLEGRTVLGQKGSNRGVLGFVQKKTPDSFWENTPDRWFTTTGDIQLPAIRENFDAQHTNRAETTVSYAGPGYGNEAVHGTYSTPDERAVLRNNTDAIPPANVAAADKVVGNFGIAGYERSVKMRQTERTGMQGSGCRNLDDGTEVAAGAQRIGVFSNAGSTAPIGRARTTTRETTVRALEDYHGIAAPTTEFIEPDNQSYYNANIDDRKEVTLQDRRPGGFGTAPQNPIGADSVVVQMKYRENYDQTKRPNPKQRTYTQPLGYTQIGEQRFNPNTGLSEIAGIRQPSTFLVEQFKNNPYTKSLNSTPQMTVHSCLPNDCLHGSLIPGTN